MRADHEHAHRLAERVHRLRQRDGAALLRGERRRRREEGQRRRDGNEGRGPEGRPAATSRASTPDPRPRHHFASAFWRFPPSAQPRPAPRRAPRERCAPAPPGGPPCSPRRGWPAPGVRHSAAESACRAPPAAEARQSSTRPCSAAPPAPTPPRATLGYRSSTRVSASRRPGIELLHPDDRHRLGRPLLRDVVVQLAAAQHQPRDAVGALGGRRVVQHRFGTGRTPGRRATNRQPPGGAGSSAA